MTNPHLPSVLRAQIEQTWTPVRPLAPASRRAMALLPWALLLLIAVPIVWGLRDDRDAVGPWRLWGASALQIVLALVVASAALAESIPGRLLARREVLTVAVFALIGFALTTGLTFLASSTYVPAAFGSRFFWICLSRPFLLGLPALVILGLLVARGLTARPLVAGALAGLAAGLVSDATWRIYCHVSDPAHVLVAHAGAIVALTALGAVAAAWASRAGRPQ